MFVRGYADVETSGGVETWDALTHEVILRSSIRLFDNKFMLLALILFELSCSFPVDLNHSLFSPFSYLADRGHYFIAI